jgi:hypothetical protein
VRRLAEDGDEEAQDAIGDYFRSGIYGLEKNLTAAANWYRRGAEQGNAYSQFRLGIACNYGIGVEKDSNEALRWLRKAAEQGFVAAQSALAVFLATGPEERLRNGKEAVRWAAKACESTQSTNSQYKYDLRTRAAAHAEAGDFEQAVKYARMAIKAGEGGPDRGFIADITAQLKLYEAGQPYHQSAVR